MVQRDTSHQDCTPNLCHDPLGVPRHPPAQTGRDCPRREHAMRLKLRWLTRFLAAMGMLAVVSGAAGAQRAVVLDITGVIGPAVTDYVTRGFEKLAPGCTRV